MTQEQHVERPITDPKRIRQFAVFFKYYMGVSSVVVAALPVPVTMFNLIPVNQADKGSLSVITSLICFLLLAFIFFSRHAIARSLFGHNAFGRSSPHIAIITFLLIVTAAGLFFLYIATFMSSNAPNATERVILMAMYTGFFACAEAAFVLMATKEYLQDLMGLSEHDLILGEQWGVEILKRRMYAPLPADGGEALELESPTSRPPTRSRRRRA